MQLHKSIDDLWNYNVNNYNFVVIIVPADGLATLWAWTSAGAMLGPVNVRRFKTSDRKRIKMLPVYM